MAYEVAAALYEADQATEKEREQEKREKKPRALAGPGAGAGEQDALDAFYSDEEWESAAGGPSRSAHTTNDTGRGASTVKKGGLLGGFWGGSGAAAQRVQGAEGKRWVVSPSTGSRAVESYQKA